MINQITGGTVEFTRPSSYTTDKSGAKVTLHFTCAEGATDAAAQVMLDTVIVMATTRARAMAGDNPAVPYSFPVAPKAAPVALPTPVPPSAALIPLPSEPAPARDPISPMTTGFYGLSPMTAVAPEPGPAVMPPTAPETVEVITDKRLVDELTAKNARLLNAAPDDLRRQTVPQRLHALVASFVPPPAKVQAIPADQRAAFLTQLAAL